MDIKDIFDSSLVILMRIGIFNVAIMKTVHPPKLFMEEFIGMNPKGPIRCHPYLRGSIIR